VSNHTALSTVSMDAVLVEAIKKATRHRHGMLMPEHLLYACMDLQRVRLAMTEAMASNATTPALAIRIQSDLDRRLARQFVQPSSEDPVLSSQVREIVQMVRKQAPGAQSELHLLLALIEYGMVPSRTREKRAVMQVLETHMGEQAIQRLRLLLRRSLGLPPPTPENLMDASTMDGPGEMPAPAARQAEFMAMLSHIQNQTRGQSEGVLASVATNLTAAARAAAEKGEAALPLVGRQMELDRVMQVMARHDKRCAILVGEPGTGKTALLRAVSAAVVAPDAPDAIRNANVWWLSLSDLMAGTMMRGELERRITTLAKELAADPNHILAIDDIDTSVGESQGAPDVGALLRQGIEQYGIRVLATASTRGFRERFERDAGLARRFQRIEMGELDAQSTLTILDQRRATLEAHHGVTILPEAMERAVALAGEHLHERAFPDKAIDVIDEACAWHRLHAGPAATVTAFQVERTVAAMARLPEGLLHGRDQGWGDLESELRSRVSGQDEAIHTLAESVVLGRSGLREPNHPIGAFLLAGPTGVGKTETAKAIAAATGSRLIRLDMSEFMEPHSVSRLIGAPPGYQDSRDGGRLTEEIAAHPNAVVLVDEIEKAHPDIMNVFLQVMDNGAVTDSRGRSVSCRKIVLLFTTNTGAFEGRQRGVGFTARDDSAERRGGAVDRAFAPEFRNRLDGIIQYHALQPEAMRQIVDIKLAVLIARTATRGITVQVDGATRNALAAAGHDREMGARPLQRLIDRVVAMPLAHRMVDADGPAHIRVTWDGHAPKASLEVDAAAAEPLPLPVMQSARPVLATRRGP